MASSRLPFIHQSTPARRSSLTSLSSHRSNHSLGGQEHEHGHEHHQGHTSADSMDRETKLEEQMLLGEERPGGAPTTGVTEEDLRMVEVDEAEHEKRLKEAGLIEDKEENKDTITLGGSTLGRSSGAGGGGSGEIISERPKMDFRTSAQRLQGAVKKITAVKKTLKVLKLDAPGAGEPGIDPKRVDIPDLKARVVVQVADYGKNLAQFSVLTNEEVATFLDRPKPLWAKRWMHCNGLSWDVIKPIALKYNLHPLSLEDLLHQGPSSMRSKADYYKGHLFLSVVVHKTFATDSKDGSTFSKASSKDKKSGEDEEAKLESKDGDSETTVNSMTHDNYHATLMKAFSEAEKRPLELNHRTLSNMGVSVGLSNNLNRAPMARGAAELNADRQTVTALTKEMRVHIHVEKLSIFLLRDGTILSFTQDQGFHGTFSRIFERIHSQDDIIRDSHDSGFILQALLDAVGDHALEIVDEFRDQITALESKVLTRPSMKSVRHLHVLSAQLLLLKSSLSPFQHLLQGLINQDDAKATLTASAAAVEQKTGGFVSHEAKVYIGDVLDHIESAMDSLDLFSSLTENLVSYTFNDISYASNSYMQALSVLSVIFLPLTFLSGYFGMNFEIFPAVVPHGNVWFFWHIAIPITILSMIIFSWTYILKLSLTAKRETIRLYHHYSYKRKIA